MNELANLACAWHEHIMTKCNGKEFLGDDKEAIFLAMKWLALSIIIDEAMTEEGR